MNAALNTQPKPKPMKNAAYFKSLKASNLTGYKALLVVAQQFALAKTCRAPWAALMSLRLAYKSLKCRVLGEPTGYFVLESSHRPNRTVNSAMFHCLTARQRRKHEKSKANA